MIFLLNIADSLEQVETFPLAIVGFRSFQFLMRVHTNRNDDGLQGIKPQLLGSKIQELKFVSLNRGTNVLLSSLASQRYKFLGGREVTQTAKWISSRSPFCLLSNIASIFARNKLPGNHGFLASCASRPGLGRGLGGGGGWEGYSGFQVVMGMIERGQTSKPKKIPTASNKAQKNPRTKLINLEKSRHAEFSSLKNFQKGLITGTIL